MSNAQILAKGSLLRASSFFLSVIVGFCLMPFIIHSLGDGMYGLWIFVASFLGFYSLFDLGLASAVQRHVSRAIGKEDYKEANIIINTSLFVFSIIALITITISFIMAYLLPSLLKNITDAFLFQQIVIILGCSFAISFPMRVFSGVITSHLRFDLITLLSILELIVKTVLIVIFLKLGYGVLALALITFASSLMYYIFVYFTARNLAGYLVLSKELVNRAHIKPLFSYGSFSLIAKIADTLRFNIDNLVITAFLGLSFVTIYSIAFRLIQYFIDFVSTTLGILVPVFSRYESRNDYKSIREKFIFTTKLSSYLSIFIGGSLIIFGNAFIRRWMGEGYIAAYPLLIILVIPIIFALMQSPSIQLLYGISKHKFFAISNLCEGIVNLALSLILVRKFGLIGIALGTAVPMIIIKLFIQPIYTCRVINLGVYKYYTTVMLPPIFQSSFILIIFWQIFRQLIVPAYMNLLILVFFQFVVFTATVFFIGLSSVERSFFKSLVFRTISSI